MWLCICRISTLLVVTLNIYLRCSLHFFSVSNHRSLDAMPYEFHLHTLSVYSLFILGSPVSSGGRYWWTVPWISKACAACRSRHTDLNDSVSKLRRSVTGVCFFCCCLVTFWSVTVRAVAMATPTSWRDWKLEISTHCLWVTNILHFLYIFRARLTSW